MCTCECHIHIYIHMHTCAECIFQWNHMTFSTRTYNINSYVNCMYMCYVFKYCICTWIDRYECAPAREIFLNQNHELPSTRMYDICTYVCIYTCHVNIRILYVSVSICVCTCARKILWGPRAPQHTHARCDITCMYIYMCCEYICIVHACIYIHVSWIYFFIVNVCVQICVCTCAR